MLSSSALLVLPSALKRREKKGRNPLARADLSPMGDQIDIITSYAERELIAQLPGSRFDRQRSCWTAPLSWAACVTLRGLFEDDLTIGDALRTWSWYEYRDRIQPAMRLRDLLQDDMPFPELDEVEDGQPLKLYPYQRVDARFLVTNRRALLANPMGLGKSGVTIRTLQILARQGESPFPALIVCPNTLKFTTWQKEFARWAPEISVQVVDGAAAKRRKQLTEPAEVLILNWEGVKLHSRLAPYGTTALSAKEAESKELNSLGLRTIAIDELHRGKDPHAQQTRAIWALAHEAEFCFGLTGTPVANHIGDLWSLMHAIERDWFPRRTKFMDRFARTTLNHFGGYEVQGVNSQNKDELFKITDPLIRRVPKNAALPQLPPKLPVQYRHTPMTAKQKKAYGEMETSMIARLNEILVAPSPLAALTRLLQFAAASAEIAEGGAVRLTAPSSKVDDLVDLLEDMDEEPLVVAAVSRQLIELASERLAKLKIRHGLITGLQSPEVRARTVEDFQAGRTRVVLMTISAGGVGITLTRASTMLFMQRSWSEVENQQCEDRIHRIGSEQHGCVRIVEQITPGSVEERKTELLAVKQGRMEEIVRDQETLLKLLGGVK